MNPNTPMSEDDVKRFYDNLERQMRGEHTRQERELYDKAKESYETILQNNGGKNPILGY
ncbi:MAG: hypothetical protein K2L21_06180 [Muribaculaceae bacterium]|nr:hypothetical protein [Muribaculaceae bacterium]